MDMTLNLANKAFTMARDMNDEIEAVTAITLLNAMLENINGLQPILPDILGKFLDELQQAATPDYQIMLTQGVLMCLWYDFGLTL